MRSVEQQQPLPVQVYHSARRVMIAAPMPGLEATDIAVTIRRDRVTIQGDYRGPLKLDPALFGDDPTELLVREWTAGPYDREVTLPQAVNGMLANATYGNGVLVLVMPKQEAGAASTDAEFRLDVVEGSRGERVGHAGRDLHPTTTKEHRQRVHDAGQPPP
jgi:HSP20 family molecular chaperone IbpA